MTKEGQYGRGDARYSPRGLYVVFDGPPSEPGRFVEVEDAHGCGVCAAEWSTNGSLWYLGPLHDLQHLPGYAMLLKRDREQQELIAALQTQVRAEADMHRKYYERSVDAESRANESEKARADMERKLVDAEAERDALANENRDFQERVKWAGEARDRASNLQREAEERAHDESKRAGVMQQERDEARARAERLETQLEAERRGRANSRQFTALREERDRFAAEAHDLENRAQSLGDKVHELMEKLAHAEDGKANAERRLQRTQTERDHLVEMIQEVRGVAEVCDRLAERLQNRSDLQVAASLRHQAKRLREIIDANRTG